MTAIRDPEIQAMLDELAIRRVLNRYCRGVDRADSELISAAFHSGATVDYGTFKGTSEELVVHLRKSMPSMRITFHAITTCNVELDGDTAFAETYLLSMRMFSDPTMNWLAVRYVDRFERRSGEWRIAQRLVVNDWDAVQDHVPWKGFDFTRGVRGPEDPSYSNVRADRS
jgi:hypothetical protein